MSRPDVYPRSQPHRPPVEASPVSYPQPQPAAPVASPRGQLVMLVGVCSLFLAIGLTVGVFVLGRSQGKRPDAGAEKKDQKPESGTPHELDDALALAGQPDQGKEPSKPTGPLKDLPKEAPKTEGQKANGLTGGKFTSQPGKPTTVPETVADAVGLLTASHLYQTYLNIGLLADSVEGEVYGKEEAGKLLDTVAGLMTAIEQQLDRVARQTLAAEEKKAVEQSQQIMGLLRSQSRELRSYWNTSEKDHVTKFHQARQDAWTGIKALLELQD